jgi:hypothetical protein
LLALHIRRSESRVISRIACTGVFLLLALGGFLGASPSPAGPLNLFGIIFLSLSGVVWLGWEMIGDAYAFIVRKSAPIKAMSSCRQSGWGRRWSTG